MITGIELSVIVTGYALIRFVVPAAVLFSIGTWLERNQKAW